MYLRFQLMNTGIYLNYHVADSITFVTDNHSKASFPLGRKYRHFPLMALALRLRSRLTSSTPRTYNLFRRKCRDLCVGNIYRTCRV